MAEYIERGGLEDRAFGKNHPTFYDGEDRADWYEKCIKEAPFADVAPVIYANWKYYHKKNIAVCTNCSFERDLDVNFGQAISCPNCGARMDKEAPHE